jgi:hypothetical protein
MCAICETVLPFFFYFFIFYFVVHWLANWTNVFIPLSGTKGTNNYQSTFGEASAPRKKGVLEVKKPNFAERALVRGRNAPPLCQNI